MANAWHEFYMLLGTAAAALVALLFVAASLGAGVMSRDTAGATRTFMSPVAFHYSAILLLSLIELIPAQTLQSLGWSTGLIAVIAFAYSVFITVRVIRADAADMADNFCYGVIPACAYAATLIAAWLLIENAPLGLNVLAGALLFLLVVNIRNAWDLLLAFARRAAQRKPDA